MDFFELQGLPSIQETHSVQSKSPDHNHNQQPANVAAAVAVGKSMSGDSGVLGTSGRDSPGTNTSTAKSSRRDSLSEKVVQDIPIASVPQEPTLPVNNIAAATVQNQMKNT